MEIQLLHDWHNPAHKITVPDKMKIVFIEMDGDHRAIIENPPSDFVIPRMGENFILHNRENTVQEVYHDYLRGEIQIWYDFFFLLKPIMEFNPEAQNALDNNRIPKEDFNKPLDK